MSTYSQDPVYKAPAYNETDIRFVWQGTGKKYQVIGFVDNVFETKVGTEYQTASHRYFGYRVGPAGRVLTSTNS